MSRSKERRKPVLHGPIESSDFVHLPERRAVPLEQAAARAFLSSLYPGENVWEITENGRIKEVAEGV